MEEKKEIKIERFDDRIIEKQMEIVLKKAVRKEN